MRGDFVRTARPNGNSAPGRVPHWIPQREGGLRIRHYLNELDRRKIQVVTRDLVSRLQVSPSRVRHHVAGGDLCRPSPFTRGERLGRVVSPRPRTPRLRRMVDRTSGVEPVLLRADPEAGLRTPRTSHLGERRRPRPRLRERSRRACLRRLRVSCGGNRHRSPGDRGRPPSVRSLRRCVDDPSSVADSCSDAVFAFSSFQYSDRTAILTETARVLRPGAPFVVVENMTANPVAVLERWRTRHRNDRDIAGPSHQGAPSLDADRSVRPRTRTGVV